MAASTMNNINLPTNLNDRRVYAKGLTKMEGSLVKMRESIIPTAAMMIAESSKHLYWKLLTNLAF